MSTINQSKILAMQEVQSVGEERAESMTGEMASDVL